MLFHSLLTFDEIKDTIKKTSLEGERVVTNKTQLNKKKKRSIKVCEIGGSRDATQDRSLKGNMKAATLKGKHPSREASPPRAGC